MRCHAGSPLFEVSHVLEPHSETWAARISLSKASLDCVVYFPSTLTSIDRNKAVFVRTRAATCAMPSAILPARLETNHDEYNVIEPILGSGQVSGAVKSILSDRQHWRLR